MVIVPFLQYDYCIVCHSGLNNMNNNQLLLLISSFILLFSPLLLVLFFYTICLPGLPHTHSRTKVLDLFILLYEATFSSIKKNSQIEAHLSYGHIISMEIILTRSTTWHSSTNIISQNWNILPIKNRLYQSSSPIKKTLYSYST